MYPMMFGIIDSWTVMLIIGLFAAVLLFKRLTSVFHIDDATYRFYSLTGIVSIAMGLFCSLLFQSVYNWAETGVFVLKGVTFMGGLVGGVGTFLIITACCKNTHIRRQFYRVGNLAAPSIVLAHLIGRIGCFMAGCCYGKPTDSFLGVLFPHLGYRAHPTQLYEAVFLAVLLAAMLLILFRTKQGDLLLILYAAAYALFRFFIEFLRDDPRGAFLGVLSPSQAQSIVLGLVAVALALYVHVAHRIPFAGSKTLYLAELPENQPPTPPQETQEPQETQDPQDSQDPQETQDIQDIQDPLEPQEPKDPQEPQKL